MYVCMYVYINEIVLVLSDIQTERNVYKQTNLNISRDKYLCLNILFCRRTTFLKTSV